MVGKDLAQLSSAASYVPVPAAVQADKDEARSQHAAVLSESEALTQQLAAASSAKAQAESALEELQATHDALVAQHSELQAQVRQAHLRHHYQKTQRRRFWAYG